MLSVVNPLAEQNGAATVTRGLLKLLALPPSPSLVDCIPVRARPVRWQRLMQAYSLLRGRLLRLPAKAAYLHSRGFRDRVAAQVRTTPYDLAILNGADLLWISDYLPRALPRILVAHNLEHQLFQTQIRHTVWSRGPVGKWLREDCRRLEEYELNGMRETGNVLFLSEDEAAQARSRCPGLRTITVPPVFDYKPAIRPPRKAGPVLELGFLGNQRWWPNQVGLQWFAEKVLPGVKAPLRLKVFGGAGGRRWGAGDRIVECGPVERLDQVWESCDFLVCPLFSTGGVAVKLAEALYNRIPVLATRDAARGLPACEDPALVFLDKPEEWVEFLNCAPAARLAEARIGTALSQRFAIEAHRNRVQQFVASCAARKERVADLGRNRGA